MTYRVAVDLRHRGRPFRVGPFVDIAAASNLAADLFAEPGVTAVYVERAVESTTEETWRAVYTIARGIER